MFSLAVALLAVAGCTGATLTSDHGTARRTSRVTPASPLDARGAAALPRSLRSKGGARAASAESESGPYFAIDPTDARAGCTSAADCALDYSCDCRRCMGRRRSFCVQPCQRQCAPSPCNAQFAACVAGRCVATPTPAAP